MSKEDELISSQQAFDRNLKAVPTDGLLLSGRRFKEYGRTATTFTKLKMWPERYEAELTGIRLAGSVGVLVPVVLDHNFDGQWGSVSYTLIDEKRLDQVLWPEPTGDQVFQAGVTLSKIHMAQDEADPIDDVFIRRNGYFLDDMQKRATLPGDVYTLASGVFDKIRSEVKKRGRTGYSHGDYVLQNIFNTNPLTVFDWEYSHQGYSPFDCGSFLSNMVFAVTEGSWNFADYFRKYAEFLRGYESESHNTGVAGEQITGLRFLGHRVPPQFYLFTLEKLAILDGKENVAQILEGGVEIETAKIILEQRGVKMDENWGTKLLTKLQQGGYQPDRNFWKWVKEEM